MRFFYFYFCKKKQNTSLCLWYKLFSQEKLRKAVVSYMRWLVGRAGLRYKNLETEAAV